MTPPSDLCACGHTRGQQLEFRTQSGFPGLAENCRCLHYRRPPEADSARH